MYIYCDIAEPYNKYFNESASPIMEEIIHLHDHISYYEIAVLIGIL